MMGGSPQYQEFMIAVGKLLLVVVPMIAVLVLLRLRLKRKKEKRKLHEQVERAKADILADGIVEGPKGEYVPHRRWRAGLARSERGDASTPRIKGPYAPAG